MVSQLYKKIYVLFLIFIFLSCSSPPPETLHVDFLSSLEAVFNEEDKPLSLIDTFQQFRTYAGSENLISILHKGDTLLLYDETAGFTDQTILYTIGNQTLKAHRDFYITTKWNGQIYFSIDGDRWFSTINDRKMGKFNIQYDYPVKTHYKELERALEIHFSWKAGLSDKAAPIYMNRKEVVGLRKGSIFLSTNKRDNTIDLLKYYLKIPKGTEIILNFQFSGNLLNSTELNDRTDIDVLRDFYIYTSNDSNLKMGISLNGLEWNFSIFSFRYNLTAEFYVETPSDILYSRDMEITFN